MELWLRTFKGEQPFETEFQFATACDLKKILKQIKSKSLQICALLCKMGKTSLSYSRTVYPLLRVLHGHNLDLQSLQPKWLIQYMVN